ncbi:MAG TPA: T9SS type A sorting domain-containing protein, partial [Bacteroidia bacterium]|nr:T9SS type A sorting domain-containing protein [Bacteroidia bacterium]
SDSAVTAISEIAVQNKLVEVYPNPATSNLTIRSTDFNSHKLAYSIIDVYGREIQNSTLITPAVIDISGFSKGIYFIRVSEQKNSTTLKFIKIE